MSHPFSPDTIVTNSTSWVTEYVITTLNTERTSNGSWRPRRNVLAFHGGIADLEPTKMLVCLVDQAYVEKVSL